MALGKLGAFLNRDLGALAKDAGKVLNTDLGTIAKGAGRVLQSDLGDLLRDTPAPAKPSEEAGSAPATNQSPVAPPASKRPFDPEATQIMNGAETGPLTADVPTALAQPFDPDATQKMQGVSTAPAQSAANNVAAKAAPPIAAAPTKFNQDLLLRTQRTTPVGTDVKELLPYSVSDFERPHATPSGELTNDPVNAIYSGRGESVLVQLALCWDADEALQLVEDTIKRLGQAGRTTSDRTWVIGPTPQGVVFAWTRDCYFFCATSPKGAPALSRFLTAYEY